MDDTRGALGIIVVLVYAVVAGVLIGRAFERREHAERMLRQRVMVLETVNAPAMRAMERERLDGSERWDEIIRQQRAASTKGGTDE